MKILPKKILTYAIIILVLLGVAAAFYFHHANKPVVVSKPVSVLLTPVKRVRIPDVANATGIMNATQKTTISSKIGGYIKGIDYKEGQLVHAGSILVQLDNHQEIESVLSAKANLDLSAMQLKRDKSLLTKNYIAQSVVDQAQATYEQNQSAYETALINLQLKTIRAPFTGTIGAKTISIGDFIAAGSNIATLINKRDLRVSYTLASRYQNQIKLGQRVVITTNTGKTVTAKVSFIAPSIDAATQTITVHADYTNKHHQIKPGQFVTIQQTLGKPRVIMAIPAASLSETLTQSYVFAVKKGKAYKIPVSVGQKFKNFVEIIKGLKPGQLIVSAGQDKLKQGIPVTIVKKK